MGRPSWEQWHALALGAASAAVDAVRQGKHLERVVLPDLCSVADDATEVVADELLHRGELTGDEVRSLVSEYHQADDAED